MLATLQPARQAIAIPSPLDTSGLEVYKYTLLAPPVARATNLAEMVSTFLAFLFHTYMPSMCEPVLPALLSVIKSMALYCSKSVIFL